MALIMFLGHYKECLIYFGTGGITCACTGYLCHLRFKKTTEAFKQHLDVRVKAQTQYACDLHDSLVQTIQGSKFIADTAGEQIEDSTFLQGLLKRLSDCLDQASLEERRAVKSLHIPLQWTNPIGKFSQDDN